MSHYRMSYHEFLQRAFGIINGPIRDLLNDVHQEPAPQPTPDLPKPLTPLPDQPRPPPLSTRDRDVLIRTLYGEARGEPSEGQIAVVHVVRNRAVARGTDAATECLRPRQFSCWNADDPQRAKIEALSPLGAVYRKLGWVVDYAWPMPDVTGGARHYFAPAGMPGGKPPSWASHPAARETLRLGGHVFLADVP